MLESGSEYKCNNVIRLCNVGSCICTQISVQISAFRLLNPTVSADQSFGTLHLHRNWIHVSSDALDMK